MMCLNKARKLFLNARYTQTHRKAQKTAILLQQDFSAKATNKKIVICITEFTGCGGKIYGSGLRVNRITACWRVASPLPDKLKFAVGF